MILVTGGAGFIGSNAAALLAERGWTVAVCDRFRRGEEWRNLAKMFEILRRPANIQYIDMPPAIQPNYQYFTQAPMQRLRDAGYQRPFTSLEEGVADYVERYLSRPCRYR